MMSLTLAPESRAESVINQHHRPSNHTLSFTVLLTEASLALRDDITSSTGSVELLRLTLSKLLLSLAPVEDPASAMESLADPCKLGLELHCAALQVDNQLYNRASFHFPVLLCQEQRAAEPGPWTREANPTVSQRALQEYQSACFLQLGLTLSGGQRRVDEVAFQLQPARLYLEDTFVPEQLCQSVQALVRPLQLQRLSIQPVSLLVSIHASLKLYIASDHTPLSFSLFERGPLCTTARQLVHALAMHYAAGALFRAGWVVGSLEILGSPASLVRSIGNGVADFFRLPYEGLTRGPGAFVSGVSREPPLSSSTSPKGL
ncbi:hypothetical protein AAFF_G00044230 [Aldrovandia affinis]|uniref:Uncharacterized protein n=1 Tax=Aldrovandia affinis TaxID=143900 RepID=A0AAD7WFF5_9TELE|nr:hypothetical protein AAFF_G00044230 [Aldrovandia affinis]